MRTTISLSQETKKRLNKHGKFGEKHEDIVNRLINYKEGYTSNFGDMNKLHEIFKDKKVASVKVKHVEDTLFELVITRDQKEYQILINAE